MLTWNYRSMQAVSTGYEDVLDTLKTYTQARYLNASPAEQEQMVEDVFSIYRAKNIFPIVYYNDKGVAQEIQKCINKDIKWDGQVLNLRFTQGSSLCKWFMPNMFDVVVRENPATQYKRFYDDEGLKKAIKFCLKYDTGVKPAQVQAGLRMTSSVATNFAPMRAKALYEHFTPANGVIYDYCMGFGGRMLGALSSKSNFTYVGTDPNTETFHNLLGLGIAIESITGRRKSFDIHCAGSETSTVINAWGKHSIDFAFSSPPYFNLEQYTDEPTQCYNQYNEVNAWLEGFVRPTVRNIYTLLKPDRFYAVNIADFKIGSKMVSFVEDWKRISLEEGFTYVKNIPMKLQTRTGNRGINDNKQEGIFVFYKGK